MTRSISLDNGNTYYSIDDLTDIAPEIDKYWRALEVMMDDDTREAVIWDMAPCSNLDFLREYLTRATDDLILG